MFFIFGFLCFLMGVFVDAGEVRSVSVMEGHSVTLHNEDTKIQTDTLIMWTFGPQETLIAKVRANNTVTISADVLDGMFRDRLQVDNQTGSLTITNITTQHSGLYHMTISGQQKTSHTFNVTLYGLTSVHIVVICCVVGSLMIVTALLITCIWRKHTNTQQQEAVQGGGEEINYADPTFYKRQTHQPRADVEDEVMYASVNKRR